MFIWSFRYFSHSQSKISDFEYVGFSSFWGVIILGIYGWLTKSHPEQLQILISNPFAAGVVLSCLGFLMGLIFGRIFRPIRRVFFR
jgi:hypothetical protein